VAANGGHDTTINLGNHDSITLTNIQLADPHASKLHHSLLAAGSLSGISRAAHECRKIKKGHPWELIFRSGMDIREMGEMSWKRMFANKAVKIFWRLTSPMTLWSALRAGGGTSKCNHVLHAQLFIFVQAHKAVEGFE